MNALPFRCNNSGSWGRGQGRGREEEKRANMKEGGGGRKVGKETIWRKEEKGRGKEEGWEDKGDLIKQQLYICNYKT